MPVVDTGLSMPGLPAAASARVRSGSPRRGVADARAALAAGSKSFRLAGRLLSARVSRDATVCYAWCRRADDLIDESGDPLGGVRRLQAELDAVYAGTPIGAEAEAEDSDEDSDDDDADVLAAFRELVARRRIPRAYPQALLDGFAMDALGTRYETVAELDLYCYRVAGVVGSMMTHVLGVHDTRCLPAAVNLGMAMQLTNISRDVLEDWRRGRLYLPAPWLRGAAMEAGSEAALQPTPIPGGPLAESTARALSGAVKRLLARADRRYRAARTGFIDLPWRSAFAIRVAALIYADLGRVIARQGFDVRARRAVVSSPRKLWLLLRAAVVAAAEAPARAWLWWRRRGSAASGPRIPDIESRYPDDTIAGDD